MTVHIRHNVAIRLDAEVILKRQSVAPDSPRAARLTKAAEGAAAEALALIKPSLMYSLFAVSELREDSIEFGNAHELHGREIVEHLVGSQSVAVGIYTIGKGLESRALELFAKDSVRSLMLEAAGNAALSEIGAFFCTEIEEHASALRLETTFPIQPGQIGWRLEDQREIFSMLDGSKIGVSLTDSCTMVPLKSESVVMGVGKPSGLGRTSPCGRCNLNDRCRSRH